MKSRSSAMALTESFDLPLIPSRTSWAGCCTTTICRCHGRGRSIRRSSGPSATPAISAAVRNGMVISWPKRIKDLGGLREQFHYVTDIMPTILEATGLQATGHDRRARNNCRSTELFDGLHSGRTPKAPTRRATQPFEMFGNRGIYHNGWMASPTPLVFAWEPEPEGDYARELQLGAIRPHQGLLSGLRSRGRPCLTSRKQMEELWVGGGRPQQRLAAELQSDGDRPGGFPEAKPNPGAHAFRLSPGHGSHPRGDGAYGEEHILCHRREDQRAPRRRGGSDHHARWTFPAGWGLLVLDGKLVWAYMGEYPAAQRWRSHQRPRQAGYARRSCGECRVRRRWKEGRIRQGRLLRAQSGWLSRSPRRPSATRCPSSTRSTRRSTWARIAARPSSRTTRIARRSSTTNRID